LKKNIWIRLLAGTVLLVWLSSLPATAAVFYSTTFSGPFANGGVVPDANINGWQDTHTIGAFEAGQTILDLNVTLQLSGGFNGDLYAYLSHDGVNVVLLNRIGATAGNPLGYLTSGMNVTLDDSGLVDIHVYGGAPNVNGVFQPDGRNVDPNAALDTSPRGPGLVSFNGMNPNGDWTLYFADLSGGGETTVNSWGLDFTATPEPVSIALAIFLAAFAGVGLGNRLKPHFNKLVSLYRGFPRPDVG
jgi:subtilisin-like proprotein convertase family protein